MIRIAFWTSMVVLLAFGIGLSHFLRSTFPSAYAKVVPGVDVASDESEAKRYEPARVCGCPRR
jgi:hypothetical protein